MFMLFCQCELQPSIILSNTTCGVNKNILLWLVVGGGATIGLCSDFLRLI